MSTVNVDPASVAVAVAWLIAAFALRRPAAALAGWAALTALAQGAASVWPAFVPIALAAWFGLGLAYPDGRFGDWPRRALAGAGWVGGLAWTVTLLAAGGVPGPAAVVAVGLPAAAVGLVAAGLRCRRTTAERRGSFQWLAASAVVIAAAAVVLLALRTLIGAPTDTRTWLVGLLCLVPISVAFGRSPSTATWGERVLVESVVAAGLAVLVVAVYLVVVIGLGRAPVGDERDVLLSSLLAALVVAALALPVRTRLLAVGRSVVGRHTEAPAETVASFGARMTRAVPLDELLLQLAESLRATLGPAGAEVWTGSDGVLTRAVAVPSRPPARIELGQQERVVVARARIGGRGWLSVWLPALLDGEEGAVRVAPVAHLGEALGLLVVRRDASAPFGEEDDRVLVELARQVGLALHNVRLDSALQASLEELRRRNEELQASRRRIVSAADESRRAIERNLHDGAQQHLVALAVKLGLTRQLLDSDPALSASLLEELRADVQTTIDAVRELAHGIYPPLLRNRGLGEALRAAAVRSPLACSVEVSTGDRYASDVEAAVYFCCLEAIQNAGKHAGPDASIRVGVQTAEGRLRFTVTDDGVGFPVAPVAEGDGFVNMRDRLGAIGGDLAVESTPGVGTTIRGSVPAQAGPAAGSAQPAGTAAGAPSARANGSADASAVEDHVGRLPRRPPARADGTG